jgi:hypothetical protein
MLAPPSRKELVKQVRTYSSGGSRLLCVLTVAFGFVQVVVRDPKLPARLRAVKELNNRIRASELIFSKVLPWYRKFQQHKRIQEALQKAMRKQISDNYAVKEGFEYDK